MRTAERLVTRESLDKKDSLKALRMLSMTFFPENRREADSPEAARTFRSN
jgi:hypothetical protein